LKLLPVNSTLTKNILQWNYHDLMLHRVHEILLVASPYDAYILEQDGRLTEQIMTEYIGMNLSYAPRVWNASSAAEAMEMLKKQKFGLVIALLRISDMNPISFGKQVKDKFPQIPVVLLLYDTTELGLLQDYFYEEAIDKVFVWNGDANVFPVIIKYIEDKKNVKRDIKKGDVRAIIVVEDNPRYYSIILPRIYSEVLYHTRILMDESLNDTHRLLRLRARPKILLCSTFEEAQKYVRICKENLLGIISDIRFPQNGKLSDKSGYELAKWVRTRDPHLPFLLQSTRIDAELKAKELKVEFLNKKSKTLLQDLGDFIRENFGFGDFIFRDKNGKEATRATTLFELEECLKTAPEESIVYHATRNHFSNWLAARGEFGTASRMRPVEISDFDSIDALRKYLIEAIDITRHVQSAGRIVEYSIGSIDPFSTFVRIRGGSLGGKARGLAFANTLIETTDLTEKFPEITIRIPNIVVVGTDEFDEFMRNNDLWNYVFEGKDFKKLSQKFLLSNLSEKLVDFLKTFLNEFKRPVAIRSSGLLEDMQYLSLAGIYSTYMLPNFSGSITSRLKMLKDAIKLVYASTFSEEASSTFDASSHRLEDEKMAVIVQELVGQQFGYRFYPTFSGLARSLNYYPVSYMKREEGIVYMAIGLGRMITEGSRTFCFSPKYPSILPQFYSPEAMLENSQKEFYALNLEKKPSLFDDGEEGNIECFSLEDAEIDGTLRYIGSVITDQDNIVRDSLNYPGTRIVTFANILKMKTFPLSGILEELLKIGHRMLGCPVELEFACNLYSDRKKKPEFCLLQIRPMAIDNLNQEIRIGTRDRARVICQSTNSLGNGRMEGIQDVILINPDTYVAAKSFTIAQQIGEFNSEIAQDKRYLLIGPGRWGSADPWLGIPVKWSQISRAKIIVEVGTKDLRIDPSFGSHFFQNVTSFRLGYLTVDYKNRNDFMDWEWLTRLPVFKESIFVKWIKLERPISVWIDGKIGSAIIIKPEKAEDIQTTP